MKETKKLNDQEVSKVSGGFWGYNKYPKEAYHNAGFITEWFKILAKKDRFYLRIDENTLSFCYGESSANTYVEYQMTHTPEEYLRHIQEIYPDCERLIVGFDASKL